MSAKRIACGLIRALSGGLAYGLLEVLWRGYTHISMIITGGVCFWILTLLAKSTRPLAILSVAGAVSITIAELLAGTIVNLWLGLAVWDYSAEVLHLYGQICPRFTLLWCALCAIVIPVYRKCRQLVFRALKALPLSRRLPSFH